jgi:hypothetical protein
MKLLRFLLEIDGKKIREIPFFDNLNIITSKRILMLLVIVSVNLRWEEF